MGIHLSVPLLCTALVGVSTAPRLQHYPENNEDEDDDNDDDDFYRDNKDEDEEEEDLYRA